MEKETVVKMLDVIQEGIMHRFNDHYQYFLINFEKEIGVIFNTARNSIQEEENSNENN